MKCPCNEVDKRVDIIVVKLILTIGLAKCNASSGICHRHTFL